MTEYSCPRCDGTALVFYPGGEIECSFCSFTGCEEEFLPAGALLALVEDLEEGDEPEEDGPFGQLDDEYAGFVDNGPEEDF